ncbi:MAG TPA: histidine kinase [Saprospiraceae bacterium]|nr:histidine kinase [Saprospiraceae bacterium]
MIHRISTRNKLLLAFGLNTFFYPVVMYVNLDAAHRQLHVVFGDLFPTLFSEYIIGSFIIFGWLFLAERIHEQFERWFGEEIISQGGILPNTAAVITFAGANLVINFLALKFIFWLQVLLLERPDYAIVRDDEYARMSVRFAYVNYVIMSLVVYYLLTHRRIMQRMGETTLRTEKAQKERAETQYALLRSRVNPHFLFNSLSTLASLVQADGDTSERFIDRLSKAYRYMLESRDQPTVPLKSELDFLQSYSFLLETRYGNKLRIETDIPEDVAGQTQVVPLTLQVLIDRALKTNRMSAQSPLVVNIRAEQGELLVQNNRQPRHEPDTTIGGCDWRVFENCYRMLGPHRVRDVAEDGRWTVHIPLIENVEVVERLRG